MALHSSSSRWVPGLQAVFAYAGHTMIATSVGYADATILTVAAEAPVMLLGGTNDGVIAASRDRYRDDGALHDPVRRTFDEGIGRNRGDSWLVELAGAGHFAVCDPVDTTSGRSFLEPDAGETDPGVRELIGDLIAAFIATSLGQQAAPGLEQLVEHRLVDHWSRR